MDEHGGWQIVTLVGCHRFGLCRVREKRGNVKERMKEERKQ